MSDLEPYVGELATAAN